jgi:hypothetical protein
MADATSSPPDLGHRPYLEDGRRSVLTGNQQVAQSTELIASSGMKSLTNLLKADVGVRDCHL